MESVHRTGGAARHARTWLFASLLAGAAGASSAARGADPSPAQSVTPQPIMALALAGDDECLAVARGPRLQIYDLRGPRFVAELIDASLPPQNGRGIAEADVIRSLAFDKSGQWLASGGLKTVRLWRRPRAALERRLDVRPQVRAMAHDAQRGRAALGLESGEIEVVPTSGQGARQTLSGHTAPITALAWTSAGLLSTSSDQTVRRWAFGDGEPAGRAAGSWKRTAEVRALAVLGDGERIALGDAEGNVGIWPLTTIVASTAHAMLPAPLKQWPAHSRTVTCLAAVPRSNDRLVSGSEDGRIRLWDATNGSPLRDYGHESPVTSVAMRPDGQRLVSVGLQSARLWKLDDGQLLATIQGTPRLARDLNRADGALVYAKASVEYRKRDAREADEALKRETGVVEGANKAKEMAEKSLQEKTAAAEKAVAVRTAAEARAVERAAALQVAIDTRAAAKTAADQAAASLKQAERDYEAARTTAEKDKLDPALAAAAARAEQAVAPARTAKQAADATLTQATDARNAADRASQEANRAREEARNKAQGPEREWKEARNMLLGATNFLATANAVLDRAKATAPAAQQAVTMAEALVAQRESRKQELVAAVAAASRPFRAASFFSSGNLVALAGDDGGVQIVESDRGLPVEMVQAEETAIAALATDDLASLVVAGGQRLARWNVRPEWILDRTIGNPNASDVIADRVLSIDFSPDGRWLAVAGGVASVAGELQLWNVADGSLARRFDQTHRDTIQSVRFSPDGQRLATASADKLVRIFRASDGQLVQTLAGHGQHVLGVAWSHDGRVLASCGADQVIKIWNLESGTAARTLRGDTYRVGEYRRAITSLSFVGDTEHLLASSGDRTIRLHRASSVNDVRSFLNGKSYYHAAVITSDGKWVVGGGQDGVLHLWNGENGYRQYSFDPGRPELAVKAN